jgi:hypothetical protein
MGYSARYHAASIAAVFLALAIGILIGVGFGDTVVSGTQKDLETSLKGDLEEARDRAAELEDQLDRERDFGSRAYPALVGDRLRGRRVGLIALGGLPEALSNDIESGLENTGARLAGVSVVRLPPDLDALAERLARTRFRRLDRRPELVDDLGRLAGRQLISGGALLARVRRQLLSRVSGRLGGVDAVILVRDLPDGLEADQRRALERLESGIVDGIAPTRAGAVAVERSGDEQSSVPFFASRGISTVDDLDLIAGRVAMVFSLAGAEGSFGVKDTADRLLPDLLLPARPGRL